MRRTAEVLRGLGALRAEHADALALQLVQAGDGLGHQEAKAGPADHDAEELDAGLLAIGLVHRGKGLRGAQPLEIAVEVVRIEDVHHRALDGLADPVRARRVRHVGDAAAQRLELLERLHHLGSAEELDLDLALAALVDFLDVAPVLADAIAVVRPRHDGADGDRALRQHEFRQAEYKSGYKQ